MNITAPGQMAGYMLQIPRALLRLLEANKGDVVSVEVIGDVGVEKSDGGIVSEEDKASVNNNPVTDRSTNLWKTFYNWICDVENGILDIDKTYFFLYANKSGKKGIVDNLSEACTSTEVDTAINVVSNELSNIPKTHEIWTYYQHVMVQRRDLFHKLLMRFDFQSGSDTGAEEVLHALKRKHIQDSHLSEIMTDLLGWLVERVMQDLSSKRPARITWEEFDVKAIVVIGRYRTRELIDFASKKPPSDAEVGGHLNGRRTYVQQLDAIELEPEEIIEAVNHYLRADVNRTQWIETGIIDMTVAAEMEKNLDEFWKNKRTEINITQKSLTANERGKLLLAECSMRQQPIRGEMPPASTVAGTYHLLADCPSIGWHPEWEIKFKKVEGN